MVRGNSPFYLAYSRHSKLLNLLEGELSDLKRHHLVCLKPSIFSALTEIKIIVICKEKIEKRYTEKGDRWRKIIT